MMAVVYGALLLAMAVGPALAEAQELSLNQEVQQRLLLRRERPTYQSYAFNHYTNYADHSWIGENIGGRAIGEGLGPERPRAFPVDPPGAV